VYLVLPSLKVRIVRYALGLTVLTALLLSLVLAFDLPSEYYLAITWLVVIILLFVVGNQFIWKAMDRYFGWSKFMSLRFFLQLVVNIVYLLFLINTSYFVLKDLLTADPPTTQQIYSMNLIGVIIALPLISINFGLYFLRAWRSSEIKSERLKKENMKTQLEALKNHLDPHFLFNNLNILAALIDKDKEKSKAFLEKFAEVYRFLLQNKGDELVELSNELQFLDAYIYLIRSRFQDNVIFEKNLKCDQDACFIPPLTIQMLIENGIKHNIISDEKPLTFKIYLAGDYLVVENNVQPKNIQSFSHKTGLKNIRARYAHFTDQAVTIEKDASMFRVKVPLIEIEEV
jgi:sensor histidine kinase YesM